MIIRRLITYNMKLLKMKLKTPYFVHFVIEKIYIFLFLPILLFGWWNRLVDLQVILSGEDLILFVYQLWDDGLNVLNYCIIVTYMSSFNPGKAKLYHDL